MTRSLLFAPLFLVSTVSAQPARQPASAIGVVDASAKLAVLADRPAPGGLNARDHKSYKDQTLWLRSVVVRLDSAAARIKAARAVGQGAGAGAGGQGMATVLTPDIDL